MPASDWFEFRFRAQPHHTDFSGIVWHGHYLTWMETARIEIMRRSGITFEELLAAGYSLVVTDLNLRYRRSVRMGEEVILHARPLDPLGPRLPWEYEIWDLNHKTLYLTASLSLVTLNAQGQLCRHPPELVAVIYSRVKALSTLEQGNPHPL